MSQIPSLPSSLPLSSSSQFQSSSSHQPEITPWVEPTVDQIVPVAEMENCTKNKDIVKIVHKYKLGHDALADAIGDARGLTQKVKAVIQKFATDSTGKVSSSWRFLRTARQWAMIRELQNNAPWLKKFQEAWAAEFFLKKGIDTRAKERNRQRNRMKAQKHAQLLEEALGNSNDSHVVGEDLIVADISSDKESIDDDEDGYESGGAMPESGEDQSEADADEVEDRTFSSQARREIQRKRKPEDAGKSGRESGGPKRSKGLGGAAAGVSGGRAVGVRTREKGMSQRLRDALDEEKRSDDERRAVKAKKDARKQQKRAAQAAIDASLQGKKNGRK